LLTKVVADKNMKSNAKFTTFLIISSLLILGANLYYNFTHLIIPDGRWKTVIPTTAIFVLVYLIIFGIVSYKLLQPKYYYLMVVFNVVLSLLFLQLALSLSQIFQDVKFLYVAGCVLFAPYLLIFGIAIIVYLILAYSLKEKPQIKQLGG